MVRQDKSALSASHPTWTIPTPLDSLQTPGSVPDSQCDRNNLHITADVPMSGSKRNIAEKCVNPFVCNICKRSYSRLDHLARHHRAHTNEKPFSCTVCSKTFGRADLLKRHVQAHDSNDGQNGRKKARRNAASSQPSSRVFQACVACASAKLKCGDEKPCQRCVRNGTQCVLPAADRAANANIASPRTSPADAEHLPHGSEANERIDTSQAGMNQCSDLDGYDIEIPHNHPPGMFTPTSFRSPDQVLQRNGVQNTADDIERSLLTPHHNDEPMMEFDDSSLAEFLRDIMIPNTSNSFQDAPLEMMEQPSSSRNIFDFGIETSLDFNDSDFDWITSFNWQAPLPIFQRRNGIDDQASSRGQQTPDIRSGLNLGAEAFRKSLWRWEPAHRDNVYEEQENILVANHDMTQLDLGVLAETLDQRLDHSSRDHILAMLLGTCSPANVSRVVSSFPSTHILNSLINLYIGTQAHSLNSWVHFSSFKPKIQRPEWNAMIIAAGAVASSYPTVRKLGYALQEAVRLAIPKAWESDNRLTRDLQLLQAYALQLSIMLWSGNKRKMEIAESHTQPLVTMIRRAGRYRRPRSAAQAPRKEDNDELLENKWRQWVEFESFKRLAFHTLINDSQTSVAFLVRPLLSYAEVSLEPPCVPSLWLAKDCHAWRDAYLDNLPEPENRSPSLLHCTHDIQPLLGMQHSIDFHLSTYIILHAIWGLIAEYRQLDHASKVQVDQRWNGVLISWHQELCQLLDQFRMSVSEWNGGMPPDTVIFYELCMMNLHVSFEELQLFAGKEGSEEAQKAYPLLKIWKESRKARQAMWHAGQIIRAATTCHPNHLKGFSAIALYHASLAFWVYGMISLGTSRSRNLPSSTYETAADSELIWLDEEETAETRRFISLGRGIAVIHYFPNESQQGSLFARLDNPKEAMDSIIRILGRNNNGDNQLLSPLVENLIQLMRDLGNAALVIGSR